MKENYDILVIGTGPAALSAALNCHSRDKDFALIGPDHGSKKLKITKLVENYLGYGPGSGNDLNNNFLSAIEKFDLDHIKDYVSTIYTMPENFMVELRSGAYVQAKAVILATGVIQAKKIKGEDDYLGQGVSYCATCDANLYKKQEVILIGYNRESIEEANFLNSTCSKVIFVNHTGLDKDILSKNLDSSIDILEGKPLSITKVDENLALRFSDRLIEAKAIFIVRDAKAMDQMVPGLYIEKGHVKVDSSCKTNIEGLFACGDLIGQPYQIAKAVGEGNVAGLSAAKYIEILNWKEKNKK